MVGFDWGERRSGEPAVLGSSGIPGAALAVVADAVREADPTGFNGRA
jgi:hypothetical protein